MSDVCIDEALSEYMSTSEYIAAGDTPLFLSLQKSEGMSTFSER